ncbi:leucine-rich repeat protein [Trypanosoma rangeli]|uniref:Leucine-rich repeat protein n=1 Tax=Trypanosoma rangeli TaxID=5698 RepID=A0A422NYS0_TRYRA|nr:leucine-rich repeat protein [Trypanosoma rangeli]RNF10571.1 leucine-rich repeat protein [Trypanosoma rangeli]|eukprot:RNF10571.1 leucine-rich repeat protein [Trypanosoma rangeli]
MSTRTLQYGGRGAALKPSGLVLNKKDLRSVHEVTLANYAAEYIYLRENELTEFDTEVTMENLKVLDLSINEICGTVDFLSKTPFLRHLYMTGNRVESLHGIANFTPLETLCLSENAINSFEGLERLPNLRVLSLNFNNISSFEHYPNLPSLHTLNLVGNPVTAIPSYRSMAIAINNPNLVTIDGNSVSGEERAALEHYQGKVAYCICEGFIVEGDNVEEAADAFLLKLQRAREKSRHLQLCSIRLTSEDETRNVLTEGIPVRLTCCLQDIRPYEQRETDMFSSRELIPATFRISGEATEVFVVGSMNNWTDPIELERGGDEGETYFHTTLYLPVGEYEYRYIVDGVEIDPEANGVMSTYKQGFCYIYKVPEVEHTDDDKDTVLHIRWMKSTQGSRYETIEDNNTLTYMPTVADVGCCLRAEVLAYVDGIFSFLYFDISTPIIAGPPTCSQLEVKGKAVEGHVLVAEADYVGGVEGNSHLSWFRITPDGGEIPIDINDPWAGYKLTSDDVDCRIKVEFTPVRDDWVAGEPKSVLTAPVMAGAPECESIKIIGDLIEGSELGVEIVYSGGVEGESYYQWLRKDDSSEEYTPIEGENTTRYVPTLEDVGRCLAVEYTPVNKQGEEGETCRCVLETPIEPAAPEIHNLKIMGELTEQHVLTVEFDYTGGHFGPHMIQWFRRDHSKRLTKTGRLNSATLALTKREVDCTIEVSVTPVRLDGVQGRTVTACSDGVVSAGIPQTNFLNVVGDPLVGNTLELEVEYFGGEPGEPIIEWEREVPGTENFEVIETGVRNYTVQKEDQGRLIRVTYTPVRMDGTPGEAKSRIVQVPRDAYDKDEEKEMEMDLHEVLEEPVLTRHVDPNASTAPHELEIEEEMETSPAEREEAVEHVGEHKETPKEHKETLEEYEEAPEEKAKDAVAAD